MKRVQPIVAIDGPAGSGKSTVAKKIAARLGFRHIDTGALYRAVAWLALQDAISLDDEKALVARAARSKFEFRVTPEGNELHIDGQNVAKLIRAELVGQGASKVSAYPSVRAFLLGLQQDLGRSGAVVLEGRDIGTVVFPDAELKFFLTASIEERAKRRMAELAQIGQVMSIDEVRRAIIERDHQDSTRAIAPLKKALDAREVDTSGLSIDQVLDMLELIVRNYA